MTVYYKTRLTDEVGKTPTGILFCLRKATFFPEKRWYNIRTEQPKGTDGIAGRKTAGDPLRPERKAWSPI